MSRGGPAPSAWQPSPGPSAVSAAALGPADPHARRHGRSGRRRGRGRYRGRFRILADHGQLQCGPGRVGQAFTPTSPTARESGPVTITVGWTLPAHQLNGAQYLVTRTSGPGSPATVCKVTVTSCSDSGLASGTAYAYSVMAVLGTNWQSATLTASATTLGVSTTSLAGATAGAPYAVTLGATGGSGSYAHWALATGILPSWATSDPATGTLSGTPNTAGDTFGNVIRGDRLQTASMPHQVRCLWLSAGLRPLPVSPCPPRRASPTAMSRLSPST